MMTEAALVFVVRAVIATGALVIFAGSCGAVAALMVGDWGNPCEPTIKAPLSPSTLPGANMPSCAGSRNGLPTRTSNRSPSNCSGSAWQS